MEFWSMAYKFKWATKDQLKQAVTLKIITADDFKTITGGEYA
jgi:hypothetical protein